MSQANIDRNFLGVLEIKCVFFFFSYSRWREGPRADLDETWQWVTHRPRTMHENFTASESKVKVTGPKSDFCIGRWAIVFRLGADFDIILRVGGVWLWGDEREI